MSDYINNDGLPDFNLPKFPKKFEKIKENQPRKNKEKTISIKYKYKYINEYLFNFSNKDKNAHLKELVNNIIDYRKKFLNREKNDDKIEKRLASNYLLFHNLEKNLIEISYISNKEKRDEKIEILYEWYKDVINTNIMLKTINARYDNILEEKNYEINENHKNNKEDDNIKNKEDNKENNSIEIMNNNLSISFKEKELYQSSSPINIKNNLSWNFMTRVNLKKELSKNNNIPRNNSEIFSKTKFPSIKEKYFHIEKDLLDSKLKMLRYRKNIDDINKGVSKFGTTLAKLKEDINNKYEIKELIRMYVNEHSNKINKSKLLKKYLNKKIEIKNTNKNNYRTFRSKNNINWNKTTEKNKKRESIKNIKLNIHNVIRKKQKRIFYGIKHTKIFFNKIKNINEITKKINDKIDNIKTFNIKMKVCGNDIKMSNLLSKSYADKSLIMLETSNQLISNNLSFNENNLNDMTYNIKEEEIYKNDLKREEKKMNKKFNLSLFNEFYSKKIKLYNERNKKSLRIKPLNLFEEKRLHLFKNYIDNKSDFLTVRKNMEILNKYDYKQMEEKNSNTFFNHSCRYDNIDEDDIKEIYVDKKINNKNKNKLKERTFLSEALFEPKYNKNIFSLYYFPKPENNLLSNEYII